MTPEERAHLHERFGVISEINDRARAALFAVDAELAALDEWVAAQPDPPPVDPPPDGTKIWFPPTGDPTPILWNTTECANAIRERIGGDIGVNWPNNAAFVDTSQGLQFHTNGSMSFHLDPTKRRDNPNTGGANWVVAAMPLENPGVDVEMRYRVTMPANLGASIKLPGFQTNTGDQRAPGGGHTGPGQFIARPCVSDWNKDGAGLMGPYVYWPYPADAGSEVINPPRPPSIRLWHPPRPDYSLWWYCDRDATVAPDQVIDIGLRVQRVDSGWLVTQQTGDRMITYTYAPHSNEPAAVTHFAFQVMYGGNSAFYGPPDPTVIKLEKLSVITRA